MRREVSQELLICCLRAHGAQGVPAKKQTVPAGPFKHFSSVFSARDQTEYLAPSPLVRRTLARQLALALAFASHSNRDCSPRASTGWEAHVADLAGDGKVAIRTIIITTWRICDLFLSNFVPALLKGTSGQAAPVRRNVAGEWWLAAGPASAEDADDFSP
jgi:hypothetical protein